MRFTTVFCTLALSAAFAVGGPVSEASTPSISSVGGDVKVPGYEPLEPHVQLAPAAGNKEMEKPVEVTVIGDAGETRAISKREEFNPLEERAPAILILCSGSRCNGSCFGVNLNAIRFNQCYSTRPYYSLYVSSQRGLGYGVYVGRNCRGILVPFVRTCYRITPFGNTFFKR